MKHKLSPQDAFLRLLLAPSLGHEKNKSLRISLMTSTRLAKVSQIEMDTDSDSREAKRFFHHLFMAKNNQGQTV